MVIELFNDAPLGCIFLKYPLSLNCATEFKIGGIDNLCLIVYSLSLDKASSKLGVPPCEIKAVTDYGYVL